MQIQEIKKNIREEMLARRQGMTADEVTRLSTRVQEKVMLLPAWKEAEKIGIYSPVRNEVDTTLLFMKALESGMSVYFPRVEQGLKFYEVKDLTDMQKGAWGVLEPKDSCVVLGESETLNLLMVPGIVFDKSGHRLGYGRAFYDRILERFKKVAVGLAYQFQIVDELPVEEWDKRMIRIITDKQEIDCEASSIG